MLQEFEKLYNGKKDTFDDLALVKKAMAEHDEEKRKFLKHYQLLVENLFNPVLDSAVNHFKPILRGDDKINKLTAQDVANHFTKASQHIEGFLLKIKGYIILFSIDVNTDSQKIFTTISIKDTSFKIHREIDQIEFSVAYIQQQVVEGYNYINNK